MGETLKQQPETAYPEEHQRAVDAFALYLRSCQSSQQREHGESLRDEGETHYLEAQHLGRKCGIKTIQLFEEASVRFEGMIEVPHRLSQLKDKLPDEVRERCIFY